MDADQSMRTKEQLIEQMIVAMNEAVYQNHGCFHINTTGPNIGMPVLHHQCTLGTCSRLNLLIKLAQQMGFTSPSVPSR